MFLAELLAGDFQTYFANMLRNPVLFVFVHVPKTAGSSLIGELVPILAPSHHILVDYAQLGQRTFNDMMDEAVDRFIGMATTRSYQYCTGHISAAHVRRITEALPQARPITLLRDPVARFVSDYRYQCSPLHPGSGQFLADNPTLEDYLERPEEWNKITRHLVPDGLRRSGNVSACIDHVLATYDFVGLQELYPLSLRLISTLAGTPRRPVVRKRINPPTPESPTTLTPALTARVRDRNALDVALHAAIAARIHAIADALSDFLDIVDPLPPAESGVS
jgi:hypothetical protein